MGPDVGSLDPALLYLIVFGPGYGESIVVRVPENTWLVVDSLRAAESGVPAAGLLRRARAAFSCAVLTHPHEDHADGFGEVLAQGDGGPVGVVPAFLPDFSSDANGAEAARNPDPEAQLKDGAVEDALASIQTYWRRNPAARWELQAGQKKKIGAAQVEVLFPTDGALKAAEKDTNRASSPLFIEWKDVRLVLGADLPNWGWKRIAQARPDLTLSQHAGLKVAHHGSKNAQHTSVINGSSERVWVMTPWNRAKGLPRFEENQGTHRLLQKVTEVHLTALPKRIAGLGGGSRVPLDSLRSRLPQRKVDTGVVVESIDPPTSHDGGWVAFGFGPDGSLRDQRHGDLSLVVTRALKAARKTRTSGRKKKGHPGNRGAAKPSVRGGRKR